MKIATPYEWKRNCSPDFMYRRDTKRVHTYETAAAGTIDVDPELIGNALEQLFSLYNRGSGREVDFNGPSMSVGDTVILGETEWHCAPCGWEVAR